MRGELFMKTRWSDLAALNSCSTIIGFSDSILAHEKLLCLVYGSGGVISGKVRNRVRAGLFPNLAPSIREALSISNFKESL
jgi:hypothetical protein